MTDFFEEPVLSYDGYEKKEKDGRVYNRASGFTWDTEGNALISSNDGEEGVFLDIHAVTTVIPNINHLLAREKNLRLCEVRTIDGCMFDEKRENLYLSSNLGIVRIRKQDLSTYISVFTQWMNEKEDEVDKIQIRMRTVD